MLSEAVIKSALIDRLIDKQEVCDDDVLVSEMVVDRWARRADLVLANGKLSAFEVKSDFDSLVRLPGQIESYRHVFQKVVVVVACRFAKRAAAMLPEGVGLWVAEGPEPDSIRILRPGRAEPMTIEAALMLLKASELRALLVSNRIDGVSRAPRRELETLATNLSRSDLATAALNAVKRRFKVHHNRFMDNRKRCGTFHALCYLKRPQRQLTKPDHEAAELSTLPTLVLPQDHPALVHAPSGPILRRLRRSAHSSSSSASS